MTTEETTKDLVVSIPARLRPLIYALLAIIGGAGGPALFTSPSADELAAIRLQLEKVSVELEAAREDRALLRERISIIEATTKRGE